MAAAARGRDPNGGPGDRPRRAETDDRPGRRDGGPAGATLPVRTFRRRRSPRFYWRNAFPPPPAGFDGPIPDCPPGSRSAKAIHTACDVNSEPCRRVRIPGPPMVARLFFFLFFSVLGPEQSRKAKFLFVLSLFISLFIIMYIYNIYNNKESKTNRWPYGKWSTTISMG